MARGALGVVVTGGGGVPFDALGTGGDAALTPFGGKYRFIDFALATLSRAGLPTVYVLAPGPIPALRAHLAAANGAARPVLRTLAGVDCAAPRATRVVQALAASRELLARHEPELLVVLLADHILRLDLGSLCTGARRLEADVLLAALTATPQEADGGARLALDRDHGVVGAAPADGLAPTWSGDLVVRTDALPAVLAAVCAERPLDDAALVACLAAHVRLCAHDPRDVGNGAPPTRAGYWHQPTTLEAYYEAHLDLCTPSPALDLHDPAWRLPHIGSRLAPAKVVADAAGRCGQALNALVAEGALIRGGVVANSVVGRDVVVDSGAEVEDSLLLDGCRIGCGARVRRAVVGPEAIVADHAVIGYGPPAPPAHLRPSGLTLVPAGAR